MHVDPNIKNEVLMNILLLKMSVVKNESIQTIQLLSVLDLSEKIIECVDDATLMNCLSKLQTEQIYLNKILNNKNIVFIDSKYIQ